MNQDRLIELVGRKLSGEALEEELRELEHFLATDRAAGERYRLMKQFWEQHDNINQSVIEEGLRKTLARLELPASTPVVSMQVAPIGRPGFRIGLRVAAAAVVLVAGWFLIDNKLNIKQHATADPGLVEKQNSKGVKSTIVLPDGSKVWLNADSKLQYPTSFSGAVRDVHLNGEAFFEVAKNPAMPFIIHLANGTVKVVGTSFNVRAYDNEKIVETSVATGTVAFIPKYGKTGKKQDTVFLTPDKKARYIFGGEEKLITQATVSREDKAWTEGKLIFKDMYFEDIAVELERNFGKKVVFMAEPPRHFRLTGSFQNNTLSEIIFYLSKTKDFTYKIKNAELLIGDSSTLLPE